LATGKVIRNVGDDDLTLVKISDGPKLNGPFSGSIRVSRYQKGETNLGFIEARDSEWQWHQLGHMQVCTSLQTDNHASTLPLSFLQAGCPPNQQRQSTEGMLNNDTK